MSNGPGRFTDEHGNRYATVHVENVEEWAGLLSWIGEWLGQAQPETVEDWTGFFGPNRLSLDVVAEILGEWSVAMRGLVEGDG